VKNSSHTEFAGLPERALIELLLVALIATFAGAFVAPLASRALAGEVLFQSGDIKNGWKVYYEKKCVYCHAVWGEGAHIGPDLGRLWGEEVTASQLAGSFWNHAPDMWARMTMKGIPADSLSYGEVVDLFSFLQFINFIDEPGDPERGREVIAKNGCMRCHSLKPGGAEEAPDLTRWGELINPIVWAQKMWNHAPQMLAHTQRAGIAWPVFLEGEMIHLVAYIQENSSQGEIEYLASGDPASGKRVFSEKNCVRCHSIDGAGGSIGPDLARKEEFPRTLSRVAAEMWNHAPEMITRMRERDIRWQSFTSQEMADLLAYVLSVRFYREQEDPERGRALFDEKHCSSCHTAGGIGPDILTLEEKVTATRIAQVMWNHGPSMLRTMQEMGIEWPIFEKKEMSYLIGFFNREQDERK
jgi:cytochrome c2